MARRELREEAGLEAAGVDPPDLDVLLARASAPRSCTSTWRGTSSAVDRGDFVAEHEEADMETFWASYDDLQAAALDGRVGDAPLVLAVLLARARGLVGAA